MGRKGYVTFGTNPGLMSDWSEEMLERVAADAARCRSMTHESRASLTDTKNSLSASRKAHARAISKALAQKPRNLHVTTRPGTRHVSYVTNCLGAAYAPVDDRTVIAENIRQARIDQHLTLDQLAAKIGKTRRHITRWESRTKPVRPEYETIVLLAEVLGRDPFWFYAPHARPEDAELAS